jgi:hypothetical protein
MRCDFSKKSRLSDTLEANSGSPLASSDPFRAGGDCSGVEPQKSPGPMDRHLQLDIGSNG